MPGVDLLASAFNGANAAFIADQYARWASNPGSVDPSFAELFAAMDDEARGVLEDASGASWAPHTFSVAEPEPPAKPGDKAAKAVPSSATSDQVRAAALDSRKARTSPCRISPDMAVPCPSHPESSGPQRGRHACQSFGCR